MREWIPRLAPIRADEHIAQPGAVDVSDRDSRHFQRMDVGRE
jgi:hypothetical protein